ncbi:hypothetical protein FZ983_06765 [Azospirillum sp. B21]|uniref:hypothetical protein n=1 Tax=Azospirillum sp. B21 TaxID=2607496 RepID=UPI0011EC9576|nr:hypothetical protein [Azospirillum sp. B21]KAA0582195.1 hypothetical protein FZ983_06765 [Azospirillum sp. B21]
MDRSEFERLRDMRGKRIIGDIRLERRSEISVAWEARDIPIINADGVEARLNVQLVAETGAKTLNVKIPGIGLICRLEVDSRPHKPAGRSHKHSLHHPDCPRENLKREVVDRSDLDGRSLKEVFGAFCRMAHIVHDGSLILPPDLAGL